MSTNFSTPCRGIDPSGSVFYETVSWWVGGVLQMIICVSGIVVNIISIIVLSSRQMNSIFYRLLAFLSIFDTLFLILTLLDSLRKDFGSPLDPFHSMLHVNFLYPVHNINLMCCIYMTVALSLERYLAVSQPIEYYNAVTSGKKWTRICKYVVSVIIFSILFNVPKFFEIQLAVTGPSSQRKYKVVPTDLRLKENYVFYYLFVTRFIVTGALPFISLLILNILIYAAVKKRRLCLGPNATAAHTQYAMDENRQALMLCAIVVMFLMSHFLRNLLAFNEGFSFRRIRDDYLNSCPGLALWELIAGVFSHLMLSANSALNFVLYCCMSSSFRQQLRILLTYVLTMCRKSNNDFSNSMGMYTVRTPGGGTHSNTVAMMNVNSNSITQL